jgi:hypothetical protein
MFVFHNLFHHNFFESKQIDHTLHHVVQLYNRKILICSRTLDNKQRFFQLHPAPYVRSALVMSMDLLVIKQVECVQINCVIHKPFIVIVSNVIWNEMGISFNQSERYNVTRSNAEVRPSSSGIILLRFFLHRQQARRLTDRTWY